MREQKHVGILTKGAGHLPNAGGSSPASGTWAASFITTSETPSPTPCLGGLYAMATY